MTGRPL